MRKNWNVIVYYTDGTYRTHAVVADTRFNAKYKVLLSLAPSLRKYVQSMAAGVAAKVGE